MGLIRSTPLTMLRAGGRLWRLMHALPCGVRPGRCLILTYHDIAQGNAADLFARQMQHLSAVARVMPLDELMRTARDGSAPGIACAITFDDGYEGVYRIAFPLLLEHRFTATVYLPTGFISESFNPAGSLGRSGLAGGRPLLSWNQVREMERHGVCFGSHMAEHGDLSKLARRAAMEQLRRSRAQVSDRLGRPCDHFAYPFGRFTTQAVDWVREAGFRTAATTLHRGLHPADDPLRLPRAGIEKRYSLDDFQSIVRGDWDFIGLLQMVRRPALRGRTATPPPMRPLRHG